MLGVSRVVRGHQGRLVIGGGKWPIGERFKGLFTSGATPLPDVLHPACLQWRLVAVVVRLFLWLFGTFFCGWRVVFPGCVIVWLEITLLVLWYGWYMVVIGCCGCFGCWWVVFPWLFGCMVEITFLVVWYGW